MGNIKITIKDGSNLNKINADCFVLEEKQIIDGIEKTIIYELYGYTEISDVIEGSCFMTSNTSKEIKYYIRNENFEGKLPLDLGEEFSNFFSNKK